MLMTLRVLQHLILGYICRAKGNYTDCILVQNGLYRFFSKNKTKSCQIFFLHLNWMKQVGILNLYYKRIILHNMTDSTR